MSISGWGALTAMRPRARGRSGLADLVLESLLDQLPCGVAYCRMLYEQDRPSDFLLLHTNPAFHRLTGLGTLKDQRVRQAMPGLLQSDPRLLEVCGRAAAGAGPQRLVLYVSPLREWFSLSIHGLESQHFVVVCEVITQRLDSERALQEYTTKLQFVLEASDLGFSDWDVQSGTVDRNLQWARMLGYRLEDLQPTPQQWLDLVHPQDLQSVHRSITEVLQGRSGTHKMVYRMRYKDGSVRWIQDQAKVMQRDGSGRPLRICGTHTDITERKLLEEELQRQAHVDYLTGACNRRHFMERAQQELQRARRSGKPLALLMLDIDHFKRINDRCGHGAGDKVLQALVQICQSGLRAADLLGRLGGEEFTVLMPEIDSTMAEDAANRLRQAIAEARVQLADASSLQFTVSIGLACVGAPTEGLEALLKRADVALYAAKDAGRNRVCLAAA